MTTARRSRADTRERLLASARARFGEQGFDATTVRDIAADAGVDPALIIRYFGSKEGLFTEITLADVSFEDLLAGDRATLGRRIATMLVSKDTSPGVQTVLRSLGNPEIAARYERELNDRYVEPLAVWLGGRGARVRAGLIVSILNGIALSTAVLEQRSLTDAARAPFVDHLARSLQTLIDGT